MTDLTTTYLGLTLNSPLVVSASPLADKISQVREMEDAGAGAVVLRSLFEEQITRHDYGLDYLSRRPEDLTEQLGPFPELSSYPIGPVGYLAHIRQLKQIVRIPIIGSLNGFTHDAWIRYAHLIEEAGADALELNTYFTASNPATNSYEIEQMYLDVVQAIKARVQIPVAVKISPYFTSVTNVAAKLDALGINGLVLFNRFYQPDIDLDSESFVSSLELSNSTKLRLRLRWIAILYPHLQADMAVTGGVHTAVDALKAIMAGAKVTMMTSALIQHGIHHLATVRQEMAHWLAEHNIASVDNIRGVMSQTAVANPTALERANYMNVLKQNEPSAPASPQKS
ncbi:MAG: dihydroorotate dehydrogenase-like protein [Ardenticatenaceae bacterium]|nr:dihydroorotate dehydrogenase-like protein [Ardenticatenaceae bacterium]